MAVSVRMDPLLEKEMEQAAKRRGITKSQFIVEAVERALGRNNPGELYLKVMQEMGSYKIGSDTMAARAELQQRSLDPAESLSTGDRVRQVLRAKHAQEQQDYAEFLKARQTQTGSVA